MAGVYNLEILASSTFYFSCVWVEPGCCAVGSEPEPVDLAGYTATLQIRAYPGAPLLFDCVSNIAVGTTNGRITVKIPASVTAAFTWVLGVYDLLVTSPAGVATRLLTGTVTVNPGVSALPTQFNLQTDAGIDITTDDGTQIWIS